MIVDFLYHAFGEILGCVVAAFAINIVAALLADATR